MIKFTTTQAKAVARKIRERLIEHRTQVREALKEEYRIKHKLTREQKLKLIKEYQKNSHH